MTTLPQSEQWVPADTFGARLALIRQHLDLNVKQACALCGVPTKNWHDWEGGVSPRRYEMVCRQIALASGCNVRWLLAGGPLANHVDPGGQEVGSTTWYPDAGRPECPPIRPERPTHLKVA